MMRFVLRSALLALCCSSAALAQVQITGGVPAIQSFDSLANSGTANTAVPTGWAFTENGAAGTYAADDGTAISGSAYSYGTTSTTERAFGSLRSGSTAPALGARLQNVTGSTLAEILVSFTKEQWRVGNTSSVDRLDFQYSLNATSIGDGAATWVDFDALDVSSIITSGAAIALDGNAPANRALVSATISGLNLANNAEMTIRWVDFNATGGMGNDDGLALDDFSVGLAVDNPPQLNLGSSGPSGSSVAVNSNVTLVFSEAVTTTDPWFELNCGGVISGVISGSGNSRSFNPTSDLPHNTLCTVTLTAANVVDTDGTFDALTGTNTFNFTTVVDAAPSVSATVPTNAATGVLVGANLSVIFSEAVTPTTSNWLQITCTNSGAHTVVISDGPIDWTVNPDSDFGFSESCTATIAAAAVEDQDGAPTNMAAPYSWTFTTGADLAPTIVSTFPANGAVNVAVGSNLTVTFSEPVSTQAGAFALVCAAVSQPFVQSSTDQTTYTLNPNADFAADIECTLTIDDAFIQDMDGTFNALVDGATITFTTSAGIAGYYERVDSSSCRALRATLHGVIDDHLAFSYSPGVWDILEIADQDPDDPTKILDAYHNKKYTKVTDRSGPQANTHYNREHTWPNSLGFPGTTGDLGLPNAPYTDTHMLYLTDSLHNLHRSNSPYRDCNGGCTGTDATEANYGVGGGGDDNRYTSSQYEVWSKRKGDLARAVLYMDFRYEGGRHAGTGQGEPDLVLAFGSDVGTPGNLTTLLAWHNADPPSNPMSSAPLDNIEVQRNDVIESFQGNRNPLIDHPEWSAMLFASPCLGPAVVAVDDDYTVAQNTTLVRPTIVPPPNMDPGRTLPALLINDHNGVNKNGQGLTASLLVQAQHGTATITDGATGAFTYAPQNGYCGSDEFTYQVSNGSVADQAVVHIVVTGAVCTPIPPDDVFEDGFED